MLLLLSYFESLVILFIVCFSPIWVALDNWLTCVFLSRHWLSSHSCDQYKCIFSVFAMCNLRRDNFPRFSDKTTCVWCFLAPLSSRFILRIHLNVILFCALLVNHFLPHIVFIFICSCVSHTENHPRQPKSLIILSLFLRKRSKTYLPVSSYIDKSPSLCSLFCRSRW